MHLVCDDLPRSLFPLIASVSFVDGITRPVFLDVDGRRYVLDSGLLISRVL